MPGQKFLKFWFPVLLYSGIIFYVSSLPDLKPPTEGPLSDKIWHIFEYLPYGFLMARALDRSLSRSVSVGPLALVLACLYAASDEIHQLFVPGRFGSVLDFAADFIGSGLGIIVFLSLKKKGSKV